MDHAEAESIIVHIRIIAADGAHQSHVQNPNAQVLEENGVKIQWLPAVRRVLAGARLHQIRLNALRMTAIHVKEQTASGVAHGAHRMARHAPQCLGRQIRQSVKYIKERGVHPYNHRPGGRRHA